MTQNRQFPLLPGILLMILLWGGFPTVAEAAGQFRAGVARVDLTPAPGVELWGYTNRSGPAVGTLDPLYARILVVEDGRRSIALISLDLGRPFGRREIDALREEVRQKHQIEDLMLVASHTHSGPVIEDLEEGEEVPRWEQEALQRLVVGIGQAKAGLVPARIGTGMGQAILGHNRRITRLDGSVEMLWRNSTGLQTGMVDPLVSVLRLDSLEGKPLAILVHYACHPVIFGPDHLQYSADFPGMMAATIEEASGGQTLGFFLQGAPGDINPLLDKTPLAENAVALQREVGRTLGQEALRVARSILTTVPATPEIGFLREEMRFQNRWEVEKLKAQLPLTFGPKLAARYRRYLTEWITAPVTTLLLNREIAIVGLPGEPFVGLQLLLRQRSPLPVTLMTGYTNGYVGYFPTLRDAVSGGYGANTIVTRVEVGAGERMVDRGLIQIHRLLGNLP
jgi:neutral ceramidase